MLPKFNGIIEDKGVLSHYIGDRQSGDLFLIRFLNPESTLEEAKKAVSRYVAKYVLKNKSNDDLDYRAVKSFLKLRPFSTSKNLFSRTILRKVRNSEHQPLFSKYSIYDLTVKMLSKKIYTYKEKDENGNITGILVIVDNELYSWQAGRYQIVKGESATSIDDTIFDILSQRGSVC